MPATAKEFFKLMVEPTVQEFLNSPCNLRYGLLSTLVLNHIVDYLAQENELAADRATMNARLKFKRNEILQECPEFQFVSDIADSTKHCKLTTRNLREVSSSSQLSSTPGLFHAPFGEGVFAESAVVFAILEDGSEKQLLPVIKSVFESLRLKILG